MEIRKGYCSSGLLLQPQLEPVRLGDPAELAFWPTSEETGEPIPFLHRSFTDEIPLAGDKAVGKVLPGTKPEPRRTQLGGRMRRRLTGVS
jgi:hypothetical protein